MIKFNIGADDSNDDEEEDEEEDNRGDGGGDVGGDGGGDGDGGGGGDGGGIGGGIGKGRGEEDAVGGEDNEEEVFVNKDVDADKDGANYVQAEEQTTEDKNRLRVDHSQKASTSSKVHRLSSRMFS